MPSFWSYISNGKYSVGCTGQTVYVYDKDGNEKAKFKDLTYAYDAEISPDSKTLAVKTTDGRFLIWLKDKRGGYICITQWLWRRS